MSCLALLAACGDEVTEVTERAELGSVEKYKDLEKCDESSVGKMVFAEDSNAIFTCTKNGWLSLNGTDGANGKDGNNGEAGASCSAKELKDKSGIEVTCGGKVVGTIKNGNDGDDGEDGEAGASCSAKELKDKSGFELTCDGKVVGTISNGKEGSAGSSCEGKANDDGSVTISCAGKEVGTIKNGAAGTSCTAVENKDKTGYDIVCGGETKGTIKNGTEGAPGTSCTAAENKEKTGFDLTCDGKLIGTISNGDDGESCELSDNGNGAVVVKCGENSATLFKASCGTGSYDPATQFCVNNKDVYKLCSKGVELEEDGSYDVTKYFCDEDVDSLVTLCGGETYPVTTQFCYDNKPYNRCGSVGEESIEGDALSSDHSYDASVYFCAEENDMLYKLCGTSNLTYNPEEFFCSAGEVTGYCGEDKKTYDVSIKMCVDGEIEDAIACCYNPLKNENSNLCTAHPEYKYDVREKFCDVRDHQTYLYKKYGETTWMIENLKYKTNDMTVYYPGSDEANVENYGLLYLWADAAANCPDGWTLPDTTDIANLNSLKLPKGAFPVQKAGWWWPPTMGQRSFRSFMYLWTKTKNSEVSYYVGYESGDYGVSFLFTTERYDYAMSVRCIKEK